MKHQKKKHQEIKRQKNIRYINKNCKFPNILKNILGNKHKCIKILGNNHFKINKELFVSKVMPIYYKHNNYESFIRQLNIYGFKQNKNKGKYYGAYSNKDFIIPNKTKPDNDLYKEYDKQLKLFDKTLVPFDIDYFPNTTFTENDIDSFNF
jgi:hypothetical protein